MQTINNKYTPKLRFPEFKKEWEEIRLDNVINNFIVPMRDKPKDLKGNIPWCRIEDFDGMYLNKSKSNQGVSHSTIKEMNLKVYPINTLLVSCSADLGRCAITTSELITNQTFIGLVPKFKKVSEIFLYFLMSNSKQRLNSLSSGTTISYLSRQEFERFTVKIPTLPEQQKIAACLSSLDERIEAENQKLQALKKHKKGLMQQLFPAQGKTKPELRFKGFKGDWEEKKLNELGKLISGLTYKPDDVRENGLLVLRSSNIQKGSIDFNDCVYVDINFKGANLSKPNDILICVRNGSKPLIGKNALIPDNIPLSTHGAFMTMFRSNYANFVFQLFQTVLYKRQVSADLGATINSINNNNLKKYKFFIPKEKAEQQKIASCLSSLDEIIELQGKKIEKLQAHKKGLMQQMFPNPQL